MFCCPICKELVERGTDPPAYYCLPCGKRYPIVSGIPDFRVWPDPYISALDDWAKGERVQREAADQGFRGMLERYWKLTPDTPPSLAARFIRYAMVSAARGRSRLRQLEGARGRALQRSDALIDIGCGTGGLVEAASEVAGFVVGVDIAARWLVIAQQRLAEAGVSNVVLVCACAEYLPFLPGTYTVAIANDVLEHSQDQRRFLAETRRVLQDDGWLLLSTQNRWSLSGEPHVRAWGVGFLPRSWMSGYVRLIRGAPYRHIRLVSPVELKRLIADAGLKIVGRFIPEFAEAELQGLGTFDRFLVNAYLRVYRLPGVAVLIHLFGPSIDMAIQPRLDLDLKTSPHRPKAVS